MKFKLLLASLTLILSGCSILSPYKITFTLQNEGVLNPVSDTLDIVVNNPVLAYVSNYQCDDEEEVTLLPTLKDDAQVSTVHNISINFLKDKEAGTKCEISVSVFDKTTTSNASSSIYAYLYSKPVEFAGEMEMCGGIAGIQCEESLTCVLAGDYPDAGGSCQKPEDVGAAEVETEVEETGDVESEISTDGESEASTVVEADVAVATDTALETETSIDAEPLTEE